MRREKPVRGASTASKPLFFSMIALAVGMCSACNTGPKEASTTSGPSALPNALASAPAASTTAPASPAALRFGQPIEATATMARLSDIAKDPHKFEKGTYATTGTVSAVCQHMGCWMEIKDDASEAHIKMAGHAFFIPKTASGKKAKVLAQVEIAQGEAACEDENEGAMMSTQSSTGNAGKPEKKGCRAEAEEQMGHPLAKLELVALGVELYD